MDKIIINGGKQLKGNINISGSKNAALPILAATLLTDEPCVLRNVADLVDIDTMIKLLEQLGKKILRNGSELIIEACSGTAEIEASYDLVKRMRASICVLGPLLAKRGRAKVSFPGGCVIGPRPIDLHLKAFASLGAEINIEHGFICASADRLQANDLLLKGKFGSSVLTTANALMAACLAKGITTIKCAAREPEIVDLANFLVQMGAKIKGAGTPIIEVEGVAELGGAEYKIISDRIEAGTYLVAAAITNGELVLNNALPEHLVSIIAVLRQTGQEIIIKDRTVLIKGNRKKIFPIDIVTSPFPGFPTDMQAQIMTLLCFASGKSIISEGIYPDRFIHISELNRMGANIVFESGKAIVTGTANLTGAEVMASDLRASAGLVLAGLAAEGQTIVQRIYHLDRGYERMEQKLQGVGAEIIRERAKIKIPA